MILVKYKGYETPFVSGMVIESVTRAGMKPWQAYSFAKEIDDELLGKNIEEIDSEDLSELVYKRLNNINSKVAGRYRAWREIKKGEEEPLIVLIGGGTAVGTTTVGVEVAHRIGIKNTIATDSIREVMRKTLSDKLFPILHASSYEAHNHLNLPVVKEKDKELTSFYFQTWAISVGIDAIIERALKEGTPTLIEGIHIVPGMISSELVNKDNVMLFMLDLKGEKEHRNRLYTRAYETKFKRPVDKYLDNFSTIRKIQKSLIEKAKENDIPVLENSDVESTVTEIIDISIEAMVKNRRND